MRAPPRRGPATTTRTRARSAADRGANPAPSLPWRHPALAAAAIAALLLAALSVTFPIADSDFWQHLLVGKTIWALHAIPRVNLWTWTTYGEPQVLPSWGFRAVLWPFYALGGVTGLYVWRWLTTLVAFGAAWAAARRMGARGFMPLVVLMVCVQVFRARAQARPETLVAVLLALEIWILEARRHPHATTPDDRPRALRDPSPWIVAIAWAWANAHISYWMGLAVGAVHLVEGRRVPTRVTSSAMAVAPTKLPTRVGLGGVLLASALISFANPFWWRALAQPFEYYFVWRHEPIYQIITELGPINWSANILIGLPLILVGWPLLALWRARRSGPDWVEALTALLFIGLTLSSQRFIGPLAVASAPYMARDAEQWVRARPWPAWTAGPWRRAGLAVAACAAIVSGGWIHPDLRPGMRIAPGVPPRAACDFMAAHGVRGRAFNQFELGGYLLWRFWPDRGRLPFMDIHQTGTTQDRLEYVSASFDDQAWRDLDARRHFDWALVKRSVAAADTTIVDILDADSTWALVFADDAAALYVKRRGAAASVADAFAYRVAAGGPRRHLQAMASSFGDSALRARMEGELQRMAASSDRNSEALSGLASLVMLDGRWSDARELLARAHRVNPDLPNYRGSMVMIDEALGARPPERSRR